MPTKDFTLELSFDAAPEAVFAAINDVRAWWSGSFEGTATAVGDEFRYRYSTMHDSTQRVAALVPGRTIVWRVVEANLSFVDDPGEWKGSEIVFELARRGARTALTFTHKGLRPSCACYADCSEAWTTLLDRNLRAWVATGKPQPDAFAGASA